MIYARSQMTMEECMPWSFVLGIYRNSLGFQRGGELQTVLRQVCLGHQ